MGAAPVENQDVEKQSTVKEQNTVVAGKKYVPACKMYIYQHLSTFGVPKNTCIVQINIFTQQSSNFNPNTSQISTTPTPAGG